MTQGIGQWPGHHREYAARGSQGRGFRAAAIALGAALVLAVIAGLVYFAGRNDWIDLSIASSQNAGERLQAIENKTIIFPTQTDNLSAAPGNTVQRGTSENSPVIWITSSLKGAKPNGSTEGVAFKVPSRLLGEIQGKRIRVTVSAGRSAGAGTSPFAVAYSTEGAGNSGWFVFQPTRQFQDYSLNYLVPSSADSPAHYVGIWSDIAGQEIPLAIQSVSITVMP